MRENKPKGSLTLPPFHVMLLRERKKFPYSHIMPLFICYLYSRCGLGLLFGLFFV